MPLQSQSLNNITEIINTILGINTTPVALANAINSSQASTLVEQAPALTGTLAVAHTFLALAKTIPGLGSSIAVADLSTNLIALEAQYNNEDSFGVVSESSLAAVASSLSALAALPALAVSAPIVATLGIIASVGFGVYALAVDDGVVDLGDLFESLDDSLNQLTDEALSSLGEGIDVVDSFIENIGQIVGETAYNIVEGVSQFSDDFMSAINADFAQFQKFIDGIDFTIPDSLMDLFAQLEASTVRKDPLVLDLDGDGIETVGIDAGVLFDHTSSGIKQGTGWVSADDGLLVLDINGNGTIDNGRELFGDNTLLSDGTWAEHGFAALKDYDTNDDGVVNTDDDIYSQLQVWQDLNQDGISQANELSTLTNLGITSISVDQTEQVNVDQNGNQIAITSSFDRNGEEYDIGQVNYSSNTFNSEFIDTIVLSEQTQSLPEISGSGGLRNLRESATLNSELASAVELFVNATTAEEQKSLLDEILWQWSLASNTRTSYDVAVDYNTQYDGDSHYASFDLDQFSIGSALSKIAVLEAFNGRQVNMIGGVLSIFRQPGAQPLIGQNENRLTSNAGRINSSILHDSYNTLKDSVYASLVLQTRIEPYIEGVDLIFTPEGEVTWDASETINLIETNIASDQANGLIDLMELTKYAGTQLLSMNFDIYSYLEQTINNTEMTVKLTEALAAVGLSNSTTDGDDISIGSNEIDNVNGSLGNDILYGLEGNDRLYGGIGNDTLTGGTGNDYLTGDAGSDTYLFNLGDGQDTISNYDTSVGSIDTLRFGEGIAPSDLTFVPSGNDLIIKLNGTTDQITLSFYFYGSNGDYAIDAIEFVDGTSWDSTAIEQVLMTGFVTESSTMPETVEMSSSLNQLIQAYSNFDDGSDDTEMKKIRNDNLTVLPVLESQF